jgi:lipopolysaccharide export system protein LptA
MMFSRAFRCLACAALVAPLLSAAEPAPPSTPPTPTVIESNTAEMVSTETETTFRFRGSVLITATNMKLTCDELVVIARRSGDPAATIGKQENFKSLIASGSVRIVQNDREATAGRAAVYPGEDRVELTEHPVVRSLTEGWVQTGPKMILHRGERRAVIEGVPGERPTLTLPPLKDLGYGKEPEKKKAPAAPKPDSTITVPNVTPPQK